MPVHIDRTDRQHVTRQVNAGTARITPVVGGTPGPAGPPGAPGGTDAAFAGWVADTASLTTAELRSLYGANTRFHPRRYGAVGDGTTNDLAALQAAANAASAAGGGIVDLDDPDGSTWAINGVLTIPAGVSLRGGNSRLNSMTAATIKLTSATAVVKITGGRGGVHGGFNINGNGTGDTTGALKVTATQQTLQNITIHDAGGVGMWLDGTQNCVFNSVDINESGTDNLVVDLGSGGCLFTRCELSSAGAYGIRVTDSNPGGHAYGYQYGPADIEFHKCLIENYVAGGTSLALIEAGTRITFRMCGFSVNNVTMTGGYVVQITNDKFPSTVATQVEFNSCNLNGGAGQNYPIFYVKGTNALTENRIITSGAMFYQQSTAIYTTDGATEGRLNADEVTSSVTARFSATGAGVFTAWKFERHSPLQIKTEDATGAYADTYPLMIGRRTDVASRMWVDRDGAINWGAGAAFTSQASIGRNTNGNGTVLVVGQTLSGRKVEGQTDFTIPSGSYALTTDVSSGGPNYGITITGTNGIASWALSNPVNLQQITLEVYRAGAQTVTWPTNVRFANNTAPTLTAGTITSVTLKYRSASGLWSELHRAADVPVT